MPFFHSCGQNLSPWIKENVSAAEGQTVHVCAEDGLLRTCKQRGSWSALELGKEEVCGIWGRTESYDSNLNMWKLKPKLLLSEASPPLFHQALRRNEVVSEYFHFLFLVMFAVQDACGPEPCSPACEGSHLTAVLEVLCVIRMAQATLWQVRWSWETL